jgi:hypothetical protein
MKMELNFPRYTFINGPPRSGKSTLVSLICQIDPEVWNDSFSEPIRQMIYSVFFPEDGPVHFELDLRDDEVKKSHLRIYPYREGEHYPTIRDTMISFSEVWMKPTFGRNIFGRLLRRRCQEQEHYYKKFLVDDANFLDETQYVVDDVGSANCLLIRLHRERGSSFDYITLRDVRTIDLTNNKTPEDLLASLFVSLRSTY